MDIDVYLKSYEDGKNNKEREGNKDTTTKATK